MSSESKSVEGAVVAGAGSFVLRLFKPDFKFNAAHFVAHATGTREKLHGHTYTCGVTLSGTRIRDGYVVDFGVIKKVMRAICKELDERMLVPSHSPALKITQLEVGESRKQHVTLVAGDCHFMFPLDDCAMLPIKHTTCEELAVFLLARFVERCSKEALVAQGIVQVELEVAERQGQSAAYVQVL